jgi:hypothetical protein
MDMELNHIINSIRSGKGSISAFGLELEGIARVYQESASCIGPGDPWVSSIISHNSIQGSIKSKVGWLNYCIELSIYLTVDG